MHNDDCVLFTNEKPGFIISRLGGMKPCCMRFHMSMLGPGLFPTQEAPLAFKAWATRVLLQEWEWDHIVTAHNGNCFGRAKELLERCLADADHDLMKLSMKNAIEAAGPKAEEDWVPIHQQA